MCKTDPLLDLLRTLLKAGKISPNGARRIMREREGRAGMGACENCTPHPDDFEATVSIEVTR